MKTLADFCEFLSSYAAAMLKSGGSTERCERTVRRIAHTFGYTTEMTILPRSVLLTLIGNDGRDKLTVSKSIVGGAIDYNRVTRLSQLSWDVRDARVAQSELWDRLRAIMETVRHPLYLVTLLTGLANASFCRLFEGDFVAMAIVFLATVCGFMLKNQLLRKGIKDIRILTLLAATCSSIIACLGYMTQITATPDVALGTSVLYLIPGIPYINSVSDLIYGHLLCCISRFIQACVLTACIGIGLSLGILLMNVQYF